MMLVTIQEYIDRNFGEDSRPTPRTVRRWIRLKKLPHPIERRGREYYIDISKTLTGNPLIDKVLNG